jgi:hypothetical protein
MKQQNMGMIAISKEPKRKGKDQRNLPEFERFRKG